MIILISPSKTLSFDEKSSLTDFSVPELLNDSVHLINILRNFSAEQIIKLMDISQNLAKLNVNRYHQFNTPFNLNNAKQALLAFKGDVYTDIEVDNYNDQDFDFATLHLRIISGLYGLLKPLDLIQPYRLEMGTKLATDKGANLYRYWGDKITLLLNKALQNAKSNVVINLASNEYFSAINPKTLQAQIITPIFKEQKGSKLQIVAIYAKKARGTMTNFIIKNKITDPDILKEFDLDRYKFDATLSTNTELVFVR